MFSVDRKAKSYDDVIKKTLAYLNEKQGWLVINTKFLLPHGFVDNKGKLHKSGVMRPVTDADEIFVTKHAKYNVNHSFRMVALLSKVIIQLGTVDKITTEVIEKLYEDDLKYLIDLYNRINDISVLP